MSMRKKDNSGVFITLEGGDGLGKSTLYNNIINSLRQDNFKVSTFDYPKKSGTPIGNLIGNFLTGKFGEVTPEFLSLAFAVDRLESKKELISYLEQGEAVFSDRYVQSNIAYQTAKIDDEIRAKELVSLIEWLEFEVFGLPRPDVEIILVAPDQHYTGGSYLKRDKDISRNYIGGEQVADVHESKIDLQIRVNRNYRTLPERKGRFIVDIYHDDQLTRKTKQELFEEVLNLLHQA